jgi:hypothetical protein
MLRQVVRITTATFKGLIMSNDLKGRNRGLFEIISCNSSGKTTKKGVWKTSSRCVLILYIHFILFIYIYISVNTNVQ